MHDRLHDSLDRRSRALLQLEGALKQRRNDVGDHDRSGRGQARHARGQVGTESVDVVLAGVQIDEPAMNPHPGRKLTPDAAAQLFTEAGHLVADFQTRPHGAARIILMGLGVAEYRQQPLALRRADVAAKPVHDVQHQVSIAAHQQPVATGLQSGRKNGGVDQVGEQDGQAADLTAGAAQRQQILGIGVAQVDGKHLPGQLTGGTSITTVDRRYRLIQQFIDRRPNRMVNVVVRRTARPGVGHRQQSCHRRRVIGKENAPGHAAPTPGARSRHFTPMRVGDTILT